MPLLLSAVLASTVAAAPPPIVEYVRANPDGSEAERILVYRPAPDRVEVVKTRARCTSAAWVTGTVDRAAGTTRSLEAGRLLPDAQRQVVGWLDRRDAPSRILVRLGTGPDARTQELPIAPGTWHLFDFDLASLSAVLDGRPAPRRAIRFALPLVWNGEGPMLRDLGRVTLRFQRAERFAGRPALRYLAVGDSPAFRGGPIWLDRAAGFVLGARWGTPNHAEYTAFSLRFRRLHTGGAAAWTDLLRAHWLGCPAKT